MRVGVDEAGKGPVLGSLFAAAVAVPNPSVVPDGVDDSKRLPPERREPLADRLREHAAVTVGVAEVPASRIDDPATDMNGLTVAAQAEAVGQALEATAELEAFQRAFEGGDTAEADAVEVVADAGDTSEERFATRLADAIPAGVSVTAEHGADERHDVVGAASVVAKVERDAHVAALAEEHRAIVAEHGPLGSGYPGDETTRAFLESYVGAEGTVPPFARASWRTCERVLARREQSGLEEF